MADKKEDQQHDKEDQNEYAAFLTKRIRALKKKVTHIADTEQKVKAGVKINADQQSALDSKEGVVKSLQELEAVHSQYVKFLQQEEKAKRQKKKSENAELEKQRTEIAKRVVDLLQAGRTPGSAAQALVGLLDSDASVQHLFNYLSLSDAEFAPGFTYRGLAEHLAAPVQPQAAEAPQQPAEAEVEVAEQPVEAPVQAEAEPAPVEAEQQEEQPVAAEQPVASLGEWASVQDEPSEWEQAPAQPADQDQFTETRRPRGPPRGRGGERGRGFRGRGEGRGGFRGRGDFRGDGERRGGEFRGNGERRGGELRGNGERRGRGGGDEFRGRGRGGRGRGAPPPADAR